MKSGDTTLSDVSTKQYKNINTTYTTDTVQYNISQCLFQSPPLTLARPGGASEARRGIFDLEFTSSRRCSRLEFHDFA